MTPNEALSALKQEGFSITRVRDANLWLEPAGAPDWFIELDGVLDVGGIYDHGP